MAAPIAAAVIQQLGNAAGSMRSLWRGTKSDSAYNDYLKRARNQLAMDPEKALAFLKLKERSAVEDLDPRSHQMSMDATQRLLDTGAGTGMDTAGKVALAEANRQAGGQARAARQAVLAEYANRGQVGSGAQMGADLAGSQAAYEAAAASGGQAAAAAQERRLNANYMAGQQAQGQQGIDQQKAAAMDYLQRFNVGARQGVIKGQTDAIGGYGTGVANYGTYQQAQGKADKKSLSELGGSAGSLYGMAG